MTMNSVRTNTHSKTVEGFGEEWSRFDQSKLNDDEQSDIFESYFGIFPWHELPPGAVGFDAGCGSGRWAKLVAPRVGKLICVDASTEALKVAERNISANSNCEFVNASVGEMPIEPESMDFGYSLGVLHHIPDTEAGIRHCVSKLKPGGVFLVYLYYAFDNRPPWFFAIWKISDAIRRAVASLPYALKHVVTDIIAGTVYFPLARISRLLEKSGMNVAAFPLSAYRSRSFYTMRTDALDRFGTRLERRFSRAQIEKMLTGAGLKNVVFSDGEPFWCAVGRK